MNESPELNSASAEAPRSLVDVWKCFLSKLETSSRGDAAPSVDLQSLEERILYDASPLMVFAGDHGAEDIEYQLEKQIDELSELVFQAGSEEFPVAPSGDLGQAPFVEDGLIDDLETLAEARQLVVIDSRLENFDQMIGDLSRNEPAYEILRLDGSTDGVQQITDYLGQGRKYDAIHVIGHGTEARLQLGATELSAENIDRYEQQLSGWTSGLAMGADILLYGCDVATDDGELFVERFSLITGADVAASDDLTGHSELGGDWEFEFVVGGVETEQAFSQEVQANWMGTLSLAPTGGETLVNGNTTGFQDTTPNGGGNVSMDSSGNFAVAWEDSRGGDADTYVQIYNADGSIRVPEFLVHAANASRQDWANVEMTDGGNVVVTWSDDRSGDYETYMRLFDIDGVAITGEIQVSTLAGVQDAHSVDSATDGSFVVVFQDATSTDVYFQRFNASGVAQGGNTLINTVTTGVQNHPDIAVADDGSFVVTWESENGDGSGDAVRAQRFNALGVAQGAEFQVNTTAVNDQFEATVESDAAGNFVVAWTSVFQDGSGFGVFAQRFAADGTALGGEIPVNTYTNLNQSSPHVAVNEAGEFIVSWQSGGQDGSDRGIFAQQFDSSGTKIGNEFQVSTSTILAQTLPTTAYAGDRAVVVWSGNGTQAGQVDADGVFFQRLSAVVNDAPELIRVDEIDFEDYTTGDLDAQNGWRTEKFNTIDDIQVSPGLGVDGGTALMFESSGPGVGVSASLVGDSALPNLTDADSFVAEWSMRSSYWGVVFAFGYDANGDGRILQGSGEQALSVELNDVNDRIRVTLPNGSTIDFTDGIGSSNWADFRWEIDLTANAGQGSGTLFYRDVTAGQTAWQTDALLTGINLGLSSTATDKTNAANWDSIYLHMEGAGNRFDNFRVEVDAGSGQATYVEGGAVTVLDPDMNVVDPELSAGDNFDGATITLTRNGGTNADDQFAPTGTLVTLAQGTNNLVVGSTIIGSVTQNSGGTLVLTFNGNATNDLVNEAMEQIGYSNSSDSPPASVQIDWTFDDGGDSVQTQGGIALQDSGSTTVNITATNDAPVLTTNSGATVSEGGAIDIDSSMLNTTDPDDSGTGLVYTITGGLSNGYIAIAGAPAIPVLSFAQADLDAGNVIYFHDGGETTADFFDFDVDDGGENGVANDSGTFSITVAPSNDAVVAVNDTNAFTTNEDNAININVLGNDTDAENDALTITHVDGQAITVGATVNVANGQVTLNADMTLTFTPDTNYNGPVSFEYSVSDRPTASGPAGFSLMIEATADFGGVIYSVDLDSGEKTFIGDAPFANSTSLGHDTVNGFAYFVENDGDLWALNVGDPASSSILIGNVEDLAAGWSDTVPAAYAHQASAFYNGSLYIVPTAGPTGTLDDALYRVDFTDPTTIGDVVKVADMSSDVFGWNNNDDVTIDHATGILYGRGDLDDQANSQRTSYFYSYDLNNGTFNMIGNLTYAYDYSIVGGGYGIGGFGDFRDVTNGLTVGADGNLYGTSGRGDINELNSVDGSVTFVSSFVVQDGDGVSEADLATVTAYGAISTATVTGTVVAVNDAPVITSAGGGGTYNENSGGTFFNNAISISDVDSTDFDSGTMTVSITSNGDPNGNDRLTILDGSNVTRVGGSIRYDFGSGPVEVGVVTAGSGVGAVPLEITFDPDATPAAVQAVSQRVVFQNVSDDPHDLQRTLTMQLTDGDGGTSNTATRIMNIVAFNDNPYNAGGTFGGSSYTVTEDVQTGLNLSNLHIFDHDDRGLGMTVTLSTSGAGDLFATASAGVTVAGSGTDTLILSGATADIDAFFNVSGSVEYLHGTANASGNGADTLTIVLNDQGNYGTGGGGDINIGTATIDISPVNDAPMTNGAIGGGLEDANSIAIILGGSDLDGTVQSFSLNNLPANGTLYLDSGLTTPVATGTDLAATGEALTLYFVPDTDWNGSTSFQYAAKDDLGLSDATPATATFNVIAVNDAPVAANNTVTTLEDVDYVFSSSDFGFSDPVEGDNFLAVEVVNQPVAGTLYLDIDGDGNVDTGETISPGAFVDVADIDAGLLKFKAATGAFGVAYTSFDFNVQDDGGTTNSGVDTSTANNRMTIDVTEAFRIEGNIVEDVNGDANTGDAVGVAGAGVYLYQDTDGTAGASAGDLQISSTITDGAGFYSFVGLLNDDYFVVVDSRTIGPDAGFNSGFTQTDVWAEQTYGVAGAVADDGAGGTRILGASGAAFGGKSAGTSDDASSLPTAEHVTYVGISSGDVANINSGFSFNVVTHARDGDDVGGEGRSVQGSVRQFVDNANAIAGANSMRFVPAGGTNAAGSGGNWWSVSLSSSLSALADAGTTIDGTAYDLNDGVTALDTNSGNVNTARTVGVDGLTLDAVARQEFEINFNGNDEGLVLDTGGITVRNTALFGAARISGSTGSQIHVTENVLAADGGATVTGNLLGTRADGSDPGALRGDSGMLINGASYVSNNYFAYLNIDGLGMNGLAFGNSDGSTFENNEIHSVAYTHTAGDALTIDSSGNTVRGNYIHDVGLAAGVFPYNGKGIELWYNANNNLVENNTVEAAITAGIGVGDNAHDNVISKNVITGTTGSGGVGGAGILITSAGTGGNPTGNTITQNETYGNAGLGIDIDHTGTFTTAYGDGVDVNDGLSPALANESMDYPVITISNLAGSALALSGYVGSSPGQTAFGGARIEFFRSSVDASGHGEGRTYLGFLLADANGSFSGTLTVSGLTDADEVTSTATSVNGSTSEFSANHGVNVTPTDLNPDNFNVDENADTSAGFPLGTLTTTDADSVDPNETFTYSILPGGDAGLFSIGGAVNDELILNDGVLDFETKPAYTVNVRVTDSGGYTYDEAITVDVTDLNEAPIATNESYTISEDQSFGNNVLTNDIDPEGLALASSINTGPTHADSFTLNPDGTFNYVPEANYFGADSFSYEVSDGVQTSTGMVTITILPVNDVPLAVADNYEVETGDILTAISGVLDNDYDAENDPLEAIIFQQPLHGSLVMSPSGQFVYVPDSGYTGSDSFSYIVRESLSSVLSSPGFVTIDVQINAVAVDPVDPPVDPEPHVDPKPAIDPEDPDPENETNDPRNDPDNPSDALIELSDVAVVDLRSLSAVRDTEERGDGQEMAQFEEMLLSMADRDRARAVLRQMLSYSARERMALEVELDRLTARDGVAVAYDAAILWRELEELEKTHESFVANLDISIGSVAMLATTGYILWSLRGGVLIAAAMSQMPNWRFIDPLPVLESYADKREETEETEEDMNQFFE